MMNSLNFLSKRIDENSEKYQTYLNEELFSFPELKALRNENIFCLILEFYQASIFTTNHLLERLLKLVLIKNHTNEYNYTSPIEYNKTIEEAISLFDNKNMNEIIERCASKKLQLINKTQEIELKELKEKFRNPYSHAETSKINKESPKEFKGFMYNLSDISKSLINQEAIKTPEPTYISTHSPGFSQYYQQENSKENAHVYFEIVNSYLNYFEKLF